MKSKPAHSHGWLVGVVGLAVGVSLMVLFPRLSAVAGTLVLVALFHLVGAAIALGSMITIVPGFFARLFARRRGLAPDADGYDFGWSFGALYGPWTAALAWWAIAFGLQLQLPALWPVWFVVALLGAASMVGGVLLRATRTLDHAPLPLVDLFATDDDLVLDAGCGGGRTPLAVARVLPRGRIVSLDRFNAGYIEGGGRALLERNLRIAGLTQRVQVQEGDMTSTPFPDAHFDSAVSAHAIDHLGDQKKAGLGEILRVLKPGGRFLVVAWVPGWVTFTLANVFCLLLASPADWRKMAAEVGFTLREEGTFNGFWFAVLERPHGLLPTVAAPPATPLRTTRAAARSRG